jgi:hypothetical protein
VRNCEALAAGAECCASIKARDMVAEIASAWDAIA